MRPLRTRANLRTKSNLIGLDLIVAASGLVVAGAMLPAGPDRRTVSLVMLVAWGFFFGRARLYSSRFITRRSDELRRIVGATMLAAAVAAVVCFTFRLDVGRGWLLAATCLGAGFVSIERELVRWHYDQLRRSGRLSRRVVMVGDNEEAHQLSPMFETEPELGYDIVSTIDPSGMHDAKELTTRVLATARAFDLSSVVIAATAIETTANNRLIRDLVDSGIHVELSSTLSDIEPGRLTVRPLGRYPVVYVEPVQQSGWRAVAKRTFDLVLATSGLLVAVPIGVATALAIMLDSGGPVFFRQSRVGQHGVAFDVLKFRTMVANAEDVLSNLEDANEAAGPLFKMRSDPRVTRVGQFLRKTSLDELPQLWNVVRGEMSLVGPRPALAAEMASWDDDLFGRLRVKPGITGMWQVSGRSEASFEDYTRLDLYYVDNWSLFIDLTLLLRTVPAVLRSNGAY
ncbi:MAG: sugar transferase [Actinomycetota bacterium]|nr:sugar transferase [Actinomycetota bacterium]